MAAPLCVRVFAQLNQGARAPLGMQKDNAGAVQPWPRFFGQEGGSGGLQALNFGVYVLHAVGGVVQAGAVFFKVAGNGAVGTNGGQQLYYRVSNAKNAHVYALRFHDFVWAFGVQPQGQVGRTSGIQVWRGNTDVV